MKYTSSIYIGTEDSIDFSTAESTLLPNGFKVLYKSANSIVFTGTVMQSTKEAPIRGATRIALKLEAGLLKLDANLGGVLWMSIFVCLFPPLLVFFIGGASDDYFNAILPWLLIGPAMSYWLRHRTIRALRTMLENFGQLPFGNVKSNNNSIK
ncbi:hypothetical protein RS130_20415 [Paraglaciecola aquimarina]|uniref:Uncharacterized protein n=1 Tax=Paraglaciecola aquimarina TaxID=1235557 RepID=A0ABU3T141_9ALTE|nr:hypothetical protein [Paraglaciecola aquimarina]MDU0355937.1 hypothetical protein [Paraglaciecola aquimarina]